jgi:hypothetical protein
MLGTCDLGTHLLKANMQNRIHMKQTAQEKATCPNLLLNWNETGKKFPNMLGKKFK